MTENLVGLVEPDDEPFALLRAHDPAAGLEPDLGALRARVASLVGDLGGPAAPGRVRGPSGRGAGTHDDGARGATATGGPDRQGAGPDLDALRRRVDRLLEDGGDEPPAAARAVPAVAAGTPDGDVDSPVRTPVSPGRGVDTPPGAGPSGPRDGRPAGPTDASGTPEAARPVGRQVVPGTARSGARRRSSRVLGVAAGLALVAGGGFVAGQVIPLLGGPGDEALRLDVAATAATTQGSGSSEGFEDSAGPGSEITALTAGAYVLPPQAVGPADAGWSAPSDVRVPVLEPVEPSSATAAALADALGLGGEPTTDDAGWVVSGGAGTLRVTAAPDGGVSFSGAATVGQGPAERLALLAGVVDAAGLDAAAYTYAADVADGSVVLAEPRDDGTAAGPDAPDVWRSTFVGGALVSLEGRLLARSSRDLVLRPVAEALVAEGIADVEGAVTLLVRLEVLDDGSWSPVADYLVTTPDGLLVVRASS